VYHYIVSLYRIVKSDTLFTIILSLCHSACRSVHY